LQLLHFSIINYYYYRVHDSSFISTNAHRCINYSIEHLPAINMVKFVCRITYSDVKLDSNGKLEKVCKTQADFDYNAEKENILKLEQINMEYTTQIFKRQSKSYKKRHSNNTCNLDALD
jgi:hypothetical protein